MKTLAIWLAALQPVSVAAGAVAGYLFGPKAVEYVSSAVAKVYGDVKAAVASAYAWVKSKV